MKHQRQGNNECQLATLAMLSGYDINFVREYALSLAEEYGETVTCWGEVHYNFWRIVLKMAEDFGLQGFSRPAVCSSLYKYGVRTLGALRGNMQRGKPTAYELRGKGQLTFITRNMLHAVAYENGMVHDGNYNVGYPVDQWMKLIRRKWLTYEITPVRD